MFSFAVHFLFCNGLISVFIGVILAVKRVLKNHISQRMQYNFWFLLLFLLTVPFLPIRMIGFEQFFSWLGGLLPSVRKIPLTVNYSFPDTAKTTNMNWMNDFSISVSNGIPSYLNKLLLSIWVTGIIAMFIFTVRANLRLRTLKHSALPLQNQNVNKMYDACRQEMQIKRYIPIYSTAFLKTPITVGFIKSSIYLPIHLISDFNEKDIRYILLHELQHCKHKDAFVNYLMNLACILYWFNPLVWYALKEMRTDREIACDSSVLCMLHEDDYVNYGNILINFAEKISIKPFSFSTEMGGSISQIQKRIMNIASFHTSTTRMAVKGICAFALIGVLLLGCAPVLSIHAYENTYCNFSETNITYEDLSSYFEGYDGCFVLYDTNSDSWNIYNKTASTRRVSPDSTYKIFSALFSLESKVITPSSSSLPWNGENYPFEAWNQDQDLNHAMKNSVNWYFQELDGQVGLSNLKQYINEIGYGNKDISGDLSTYWLESSLKISPVEQVHLLQKLHDNDYHFSQENIDAVKNAMLLESASPFYGKTGTGNVNGKDINGWFIGYIEKSDTVYFFATNIHSEENATGTTAAKITLSILSDMDIYHKD